MRSSSEPTNTDDELADIVHRIFQRGVQAEREARGDFSIKDGGPEFAKQAYVQQLQAHADSRVAEARRDGIKDAEEVFMSEALTAEEKKRWYFAQLAQPNHKEEK